MDQDAGAGGGMENTFEMTGLVPDDLQMQIDPDMMNINMSGMQGMDMTMSQAYGNMMDTSGPGPRGPGQQKFTGNQMNQGVNIANFGTGPPSDLDGFQFDPSPMPPNASSMAAGVSPAAYAQSPASSTGTRTSSLPNGGGIARRRFEKAQKARRRASAGNLGLDTSYSGMNTGMTSMGQSPIYPMTASGVPMSMDSTYYSNPAISALSMGMDFAMSQPGSSIQNPMAMPTYRPQGMNQNQAMDMSQSMNQNTNLNQNQGMGQAKGTPASQDNTSQRPSIPETSPSRRRSYPPAQAPAQAPAQMPSLRHRESSGSRTPKHNMDQQGPKPQQDSGQTSGMPGHNEGQDDIQRLARMSVADSYNHSQLMSQMQAVIAGHSNQAYGMPANGRSFPHGQPSLHDNNNFNGFAGNSSPNVNNFSTGQTNSGGLSRGDTSQSIPHYMNAYSQSGFDMLSVLMRVATRPKPRINIGAVDMSCAFVVCDVSQHDLPIVYCSEMFERLTGYNRHEILGRNCRFLQAPDGRVESGIKRKYVDDGSVLHLKNMINQRQEAQISLINYRKGGQPFMNLLTMIPVSWETDEIRYYVGFQVDLVEQPTSITNKNPDGTYQINYQRGWLPRYVFNPAEHVKVKDPEIDRSVPNDEVTTILSTINTDSELTKRLLDKVLLENTDDVVHVLSLKGLFLYLSPSCKRILEYDAHELVGTALSAVCHPSDIVPVTRELKDTTTGAAVSVIFRIRRKFSGYTWFEARGALHNEQGKSKKCIILVGRSRPVYALLRNGIVNGFGESELWTKLSTTGMFLYVSQHVKSLLDRVPEELVGTSAQNLMRAEGKAEFGKALEFARTGHKHTFKHEVQNKRGQTLHAETTLYPGDSTEGSKPTFIIGQTRLLKMGRGQPALLKQSSSQSDRSSTIHNPTGTASPGTQNTGLSRPPSDPRNGPQAVSNPGTPTNNMAQPQSAANGILTSAGAHSCGLGNQDELLAADDNVFDELKTTRSTSWQFELRQMEKRNRLLAEELQSLLSSRKKRKRRKGLGQLQKDCANCHTRNTPEWRRGPSGQRDLCNSCGLRWAKQQGRISPRTSSQHSGDKHSQASSPRASHGDRMTTAASVGSPAHGQTPHRNQMNGSKEIKVEMPTSIAGNATTGPAATGQRTVPQTIQEGEEPADEEL